MMRGFAGAVVILFWAASASAQQLDGGGVPYRSWDVNTSVGLHVTESRDAGAPVADDFDRGEDGTAAFTVDVGRYWTSHFKTEAALQLRPDWTSYTYDNVRLPSGQIATAWRHTDISLVQISAGATWQFLENTFAHPYVSAGARIGVARRHSVRDGRAQFFDGRQYTYHPIAIDEGQSTEVIARPFLAGGFKAYFNERIFTRPEVSAAWSSNGMSQLTFRLGVGIDF